MLQAVKLLNFRLPGSMNLLTFSLPETKWAISLLEIEREAELAGVSQLFVL